MTLVYVGHWALFSFASVLFSQQGEIWCIFSFMVEKTIRKLGGQPFHFNDFTALSKLFKVVSGLYTLLEFKIESKLRCGILNVLPYELAS